MIGWKIVFTIEALVIITGNLLVIVSSIFNRILRKRRYFLLLNLSLADLMVGMVTIPLYLYILHTGYHGSAKKAFVFFDVFLGVESLLGLLALSWERLYAICCPIKHRTIRKQNLLVLISVTWTIATITGVVSTTGHGNQYVFFYFVLPFLTLILVLICINYVIIWVKVHASKSVGDGIQCSRTRHDRKLAMTLFIVTILSLLAWLPLEVLNILIPLCSSCKKSLNHIFYLAKFLQFGNSLINPLIYALRMPEFRNALRKLVFFRSMSRRTFDKTPRKKKSVLVTLL